MEIIYIVFQLSEEIYEPSKPSHVINQSLLFIFSRVGLSSTRFLRLQVTWLTKKRWIRGSALIGCARGPPDRITRTWLIKGIITALMKRRGAHLDRPIAIQEARFKASYNAYLKLHLDAPSTIRRLRHFQNGPRWTVSS